MKKLPHLLILCFFSFSVQAQSLLKYTVVTKSDIFAECSDFMGQTLAGGNVYLRDFLIEEDQPQLCPLHANGKVSIVRSAIQKRGQHDCISSPVRIETLNTGHDRQIRRRRPIEPFAMEMDELSGRLKALSNSDDFKVLSLNGNDLLKIKHLDLDNSAPLIINVSGKNVSISHMGLSFSHYISPEKIVWNFYEAQEVVLNFSGVDSKLSDRGFPGTILAPFASVKLNNILVSGGVYADSFLGKAEGYGCQGIVSGQVEPYCLTIEGLGLGCERRGGKE